MNILTPMLAAATLTLWATAAAAEPYTLMIFETTGELALRTDPGEAGKAYWAGYGRFAQEATAAGILKGGTALHATEKVSAVTLVGGNAETDAAFDNGAATRLSGFFQIDVASEADAIAWASRIPAAATGRIEIRAGYPAPGMN